LFQHNYWSSRLCLTLREPWWCFLIPARLGINGASTIREFSKRTSAAQS